MTLIPNGNFATPAEATFSNSPGPSAHWAFGGGAAIHSQSGSPYGPPVSPQGNAQCAGMQGAGSITQTFDLAPGSYALNFNIAEREPNDGAPRNPVNVIVNGVTLASGLTAPTGSYTPVSLPFNNTDTSATVSFVSTFSGSADVTVFIDNVALALSAPVIQSFTQFPAAATSGVPALPYTPDSVALVGDALAYNPVGAAGYSTTTAGSGVVVHFSGTNLTLAMYGDGSTSDAVDFQIDGGAVTTLDTRTFNPNHNPAAYVVSGLSAGAHTLAITNRRTSASGNGYLIIEGISQVHPQVPQYEKFELTAPCAFNASAPNMYYENSTPAQGASGMYPNEDTRNGLNVYATFQQPDVPQPGSVADSVVSSGAYWTATGSANLRTFDNSARVGAGGNAGTLSTLLTGLVAGQSYRVSYGDNHYYTNFPIQVSVDTATPTPYNSGYHGGNDPTITSSFTFVATAASHRITFSAPDGNGGDAHLVSLALALVPGPLTQHGYWDARTKTVKVKFFPRALGVWAYTLFVQDAVGTSASSTGSFVCTPRVAGKPFNGYIRTATSAPRRPTDSPAGRDARYLVDADDKALVYMGACGISGADTTTGDLDWGTFCARKGISGVNRVWLSAGGSQMLGALGDANSQGNTGPFIGNSAPRMFPGEAYQGRFSVRLAPGDGFPLQPDALDPAKTYSVTGWVDTTHATGTNITISTFALQSNSTSAPFTASGFQQFRLAGIPGNLYQNTLYTGPNNLSGGYLVLDWVEMYDESDAARTDILGGSGHFEYQAEPNHRRAYELEQLVESWQAAGTLCQLNLFQKGDGNLGAINGDSTNRFPVGTPIDSQDSSDNARGLNAAGGNSYTISNAQPLGSIPSNDTLVRRLLKNKVKFALALVGGYPCVAMFEANNEMNDGNGHHYDQCNFVADELHTYNALYGSQRVATGSSSLGNIYAPALFEPEGRMPLVDVGQIHCNPGGSGDAPYGTPYRGFYNIFSGDTADNTNNVVRGVGGPNGTATLRLDQNTVPLYLTLPMMRASDFPSGATWTLTGYVKPSPTYAANGPVAVSVGTFANGADLNFANRVSPGVPASQQKGLWQKIMLTTFTLSTASDAGFVNMPHVHIDSSQVSAGYMEIADLRLTTPEGLDYARFDCDLDDTGKSEGAAYNLIYNAAFASPGGYCPARKPTVIGEQNIYGLDVNGAKTVYAPAQIKLIGLHAAWTTLAAQAHMPLWWTNVELRRYGGYDSMKAVQAFAAKFDLSSGYYRELRVSSPPLARTGVRPLVCFGQSEFHYGNPAATKAYVVALVKSTVTDPVTSFASFTLPAGLYTARQYDLGTLGLVQTTTLVSDGIDPVQYHFFNTSTGFALELTKS